MSDPKDTSLSGGGDPFEYVGHRKFGPAEGKPVIPTKTLDEWLDRSREEFTMKRMVTLIYNFSDEEMEEWARGFGTTAEIAEAMTMLAEFIGVWAGAYEAGADVFNSAMARCIVIGERIEAQQKAY